MTDQNHDDSPGGCFMMFALLVLIVTIILATGSKMREIDHRLDAIEHVQPAK